MQRTTLEAIKNGKNIADRGRSRANKRFFFSPASSHKLVRMFNQEHRKAGYGVPLPLSKKTLGMVSGFIKLGRSNGWEEERFYRIIQEVVKYWDHIKSKSLKTLNGKIMILSDRPTLLEFLIARDSILIAIEEIKSREEVFSKNTEEEKVSVKVSTTREEDGPREDELEAEYAREMEKYLDTL